ncbi:hypothetical protein EZV73_17025 [Acidaminobacter sp. JC074]|uniref:hypothetical protein n=1 Tax=Acidaminobacter sp. JC074 TaxID=2530199 RepID=UPI001F0DC439|nr:hypothetical protein [Acidaminobacter sp. JC074]MCH4889303.1 hypothetical protein [Acidaminobacter sp. JC074]
MEVINCKSCGKMFHSVMGIKRCPACRQADDAKFKMIKEYLYDCPGATIEEVVENLGVERRLVLDFLREGRLETIGPNMVIQCENCGEPIHSGKYCDKCHREITLNLRSAANAIKKPRKLDKGTGMHIKNKKK